MYLKEDILGGIVYGFKLVGIVLLISLVAVCGPVLAAAAFVYLDRNY